MEAFSRRRFRPERNTYDCMGRAGIPAAGTTAAAVGNWLIRRKMCVGKNGGQAKTWTHLRIDQMAAFSNPPKPSVAGGKTVAEHAHQFGLHFFKSFGPFDSDLLL